MHPTHQASHPGKFQGSDFWLQVRVRRTQTPGAPPDSAAYSYITGKLVWLTTTNSSYTAQELVTYGQSASNGDVVGQQSRHNIYSGQNFNSIGSGQPNATVAISNITQNWRYSGGWDTRVTWLERIDSCQLSQWFCVCSKLHIRLRSNYILSAAHPLPIRIKRDRYALTCNLHLLDTGTSFSLIMCQFARLANSFTRKRRARTKT